MSYSRATRTVFRFMTIVALALSLVSVSFAKVATHATPSVRLTSKINNAQRTTLAGHVPSAIRNGFGKDLGRVAPSTRLEHVVMVLQGTADQEHALRVLIDQQHDKNSVNFHQWLTPEESGQLFGVSDADIATLSAWMAKQGLSVEKVSKSKRFIQFNGTVANFESAFQTEFHNYSVNGESHVSISKDLSIPAAISPVVRAIPSVHNFFKKPFLGPTRTATVPAAPSAKGPVPQLTNGTSHFVGPNDFAVIYNTAPLLAAGITGKGVTIGIVGRTDIHLADVEVYRQMFGLPANDPNFILAGDDPGVAPGDDGESYLDVEVSGAAAPNATIDFVTSKSTLTVDGIDLSMMYIVENNIADITSESYGLCEASLGADNAFQNALYEQAAAQGISVFVSSGDNGPAACDSSSSTYSTYGYAVSGDASTPYNVAVGGTIFSEGSGTYWATSSSAPTNESALSYIPETPWNEAKGSGATGASGLWSGSGGISAYYGTPSWQRGPGITGTDPAYVGTAGTDPASPVVAGPHRYLPDVALNAASGHDGTVYCGEGVCTLSSTGSWVNLGLVGGTSVASPSMAGIQALVDQANGGRQGQPNYHYYSLAIANNTAGLNCASITPPAAGCVFNDVTTGNTLICRNSSCTTANKIGWAAAAGYDLATGLGSVNANNLATQWSSVTFNSSVTTLTVAPNSGLTHGSATTLTISVAAGSGSGTPTGDVAFYTDGGAITNPVDENSGLFLNQAAFCTLTSGACTVSLASLPAGTYNVYARYGGDMTYGSSVSAPQPVTVTAENSAISLTPYSLNCTSGAMTSTTAFPYGSLIFFDTKVTGVSLQGVPTGTVAITDNGNPLTTVTLNAQGDSELVSGVIATTSCVYGYSYNNLPPLAGGTHVLNASYSGDASFDAVSLGSPVTITVSPATLTASLKVITTSIAAGGTAQLELNLTPQLAASLPVAATGTVTFTDTTTSTILGVVPISTGLYANVSYYLAALSTTALSTTGTHTITAVYSGDANYASTTSTGTITVLTATGPTVTLTSTTLTPTVAATNTLTAALSASSTGTVYFYDGTTVLGTTSISNKTSATLATQTLLHAGTHVMTALFSGSTTVRSSTSAPITLTVAQATPTVNLSTKNADKAGKTFALQTVVTVAENTSYVAYVAPTGTVQFYDGATPLGSPLPLTVVPYASGGYGIYSAQYIATALTPGVHTITSVFTDPNYVTTTSNAQTVTVTGAPVGNLELAVDTGTAQPTIKQAGGTLYVSGWAADAVDGSPLSSVLVYIDGVSVGAPTLGLARPDVATYFNNPAYANSGYTFTYAASNLTGGTHKVTVVATNSGKVSTTFGPLTITVTTAPVGFLDMAVDTVTSQPTIKQNGKLYVSGWAADPTDGSPLKNVVVYIDGNSIGAPTLGVARPDVAAYFNKPAYANSGFTMTYSVASLAVGTHAVTVVATNSQGISTTLGPLSITVTAVKTPPVGNLDIAVDAVTVSTTVLQSDPLYVSGWAASPTDNGSATSVQIQIDGVGVGYATLGLARPDVAAYFNKPAWANSGWVFVISASSLTSGPHTVSAVASDSSALTTTLGPVAITVQ